jgi:hypothetical protein
MSVTILCNCHTCGELGRAQDTHFMCKAALYRYDDTPDPALTWLRRNCEPDSGICRDDADDCPCWRVAADCRRGGYYK